MRKFYPVKDRIPHTLLEHLGATEPAAQRNVRAVQTGEFRCPQRNEWYLSGAIVEAYRAPNDLTTDYYIARLVLVQPVTVEQVVAEQTDKTLPTVYLIWPNGHVADAIHFCCDQCLANWFTTDAPHKTSEYKVQNGRESAAYIKQGEVCFQCNEPLN